MEDKLIVDLYHARNEYAIVESEKKYGAYCRSIARNLLTLREDAEECVSDTWHAAWNRMPPEWPECLKSFLGRITRNLSISRWRAGQAQKRRGVEVLLSELEECVPANQSTEEAAESRELARILDGWLEGLSADDATLFLRRYWYGDKVAAIALAWGVPANRLSQRLHVMRRSLRTYLESEGVTV